MTPEHLLPSNATPLEIALSEASAYAALHAPIEAIRRFKTDPADPLLPWLIWEYGMAELLPYLPEPRRAIAEGVLWQRLRGTPRAFKIALSWIGAGVVTVEQEEPGGAHWAEFQIDPGRWLAWDEIGRILAVARLSAPARSRLSRLYHGFDVRRVKLDAARLDDALLSDYSGARWQDGVTRVSFGRLWQDTADAAAARAGSTPDAQRLAAHARYGRYADRCLLSEMRFGCRPVPNPVLEVASAHELAQLLGVRGLAGLLPERRFAKAQVVLSDQWPLGETNACLPARIWQPADAPLRLGDALSSGIGAGRWVAITERLEAEHGRAVELPAPSLTAARAGLHAAALRADRELRLSDLILSQETHGRFGRAHAAARASALVWAGGVWHWGGARAHGQAIALPAPQADAILVKGRDALWRLDVEIAAQPARSSVRHGQAAYRAQRWAARWQARSWTQARECLQSQHTSTVE